MIIHKTMSDSWLSNTYLVADRPGGHAVVIDTGGPIAPILSRIEVLRLNLTHILCTHHHVDHVAHNRELREQFGCPVCGHGSERHLFDGLDVELRDGEELTTGDLRIRALHVPGHTVGQLSFVVNEERVFTGDTLFKASVGGTLAPGHGSFDELRCSVMDVLMRLPTRMKVHPGHTEPTTIGAEWETNPFIRIWRGLDHPAQRPCIVSGRPATLLLRARDYDGGTKCWIRFDDGALEIVPGSQTADV